MKVMQRKPAIPKTKLNSNSGIDPNDISANILMHDPKISPSIET